MSVLDQPFGPGRILDISEDIKFQIEVIEADENDRDHWDATGAAIVKVPADATSVTIDPITSRYGLDTWLVRYDWGNKKVAIPVKDRFGYDEGRVGDEKVAKYVTKVIAERR